MKKTFPLTSYLPKSLFLKAFSIIICCLLLHGICYSQKPTKEEKKIYKKAKKYLANEKFKKAQINYLKLIEINSTDETYNFEGGLSFYFTDFERAKCIPLFEATIENSKEDTIPEIYYYLARAYHFNGEYEKATEAFNKFKPFIKTNSKSGQELMKQSDYYIKISDNGNKYLADKNENIVITNLGKNINSSYGEYAPVLKESEDVLLFTSRRKSANSKKTDKDLLPYENVYVAKKSNNEWQLLTDKEEVEKYIPKNLNTKKHDAGIIYSSDGKTLYTYKNDAIWKSLLENGKWSKLVELDKNINSSQYNIPSVSLSEDGNTIFFVSYRKDGIGGKDIYKSIKNSEGNWSKAENLGENINTKFDEDSPFISKDGNTLYFSSKGHEGIGGYDIFKSQLIDGSWSAPENMGIPVNSSVDDIYLIIDSEEKNGFFASARDGGSGGMDIYQVCMYCPSKTTNSINGLLVNDSGSPIDGSIVMKEISTDNIIGTYQAKDGKFSITTESVGKHEILVEAVDFEKQVLYIELPNKSSESDIKIKLNQFQKEGETYQVINVSSNKLGLNQSDTIKVETIIAANNTDNTDNTDNSNDSDNNQPSTTLIGSYQDFYSYNSKEFNTNSSQFTTLINNAANKVKDGNKIYIDIESSASRVPTKTYKSNINLASLRGDEAKQLIINSLKEKGISEDNIVINKINSIVSGPKYTGDFNNTEKYQKF
ncbi:MAG: PD40 domain-containing protein, partial [Flavobacteriales bacterium]|nr:PD40 domain-containing protein [Flavobacteriales bacterium]